MNKDDHRGLDEDDAQHLNTLPCIFRSHSFAPKTH